VRLDAVWVERLDVDCERSQVFSNSSEYLDDLHEWLIYGTAAPESRFEDWLHIGGKRGSRTY
jgi:hypothetical protein